jgi:putative FmdB family regulatory protein
MPTYEYRCPEGHEFEKFQRITEPPVLECPTCGQPSVRVLSGGAGLLFKGQGFYITDNRSDSYRKAADQEKGGGAKGGEAGPASKPKQPGSGGGSAGAGE